MKTIHTALASLLVVGVSSGVAMGQDTEPPVREPEPARGPAPDTERELDRQPVRILPAGLAKGTALMDCVVHDEQDAEVARVGDLVIASDGRVVAALLQLTDDEQEGRVALPMPLLRPVKDEDDARDATVIGVSRLRLDAEMAYRLLDAPRYTMTAPLSDDFLRRAYEHFSVPPSWDAGATAKSGDGRGSATEADDAMTDDAMTDDGVAPLPIPSTFTLASSLIDRQVHNLAAEEVGEIGDLAVAIDRQQIAYAVLECGGLLDTKRFAVPYPALAIGASDQRLLLDVDPETLESREGFDEWPHAADPALFAATVTRPAAGLRR